MQEKIIITAPVNQPLITAFEAKGFQVIYEPSISYKGLALIVNQASGLVATTRIRIDKPIIDKAEQLKWIGRLGSGMELIDEVYAKEKNIQCFSTPEGNRQAVAEHVLGLILNLNNNLTKSYLEVKQHNWLRNENRGIELMGKTVGIIGYGNNGEALAKLLQPFNVTVLAYDKYRFGFAKDYIKEASLEQVCKYSDVISLHIPLTEETHHMVNADFFNLVEQKPLLINACRGKVIHTPSLIQALKDKKIRAAGLDVLENESLDTHNAVEQTELEWLLSQPNVIITPHIAGYSNEASCKMGEVLLKKLGL